MQNAMMTTLNSACPCGSGKDYIECCKPFHDGDWAQNALQLMRSRYTAYALILPRYIIETTHPTNPAIKESLVQWTGEIIDFCEHTKFEKLEILDFQDGDQEAYVTFTAHLSRDSTDNTFTEKSRFEKMNGKWYYQSGQIFSRKGCE
jgi:SEC-C motif-containing protein